MFHSFQQGYAIALKVLFPWKVNPKVNRITYYMCIFGTKWKFTEFIYLIIRKPEYLLQWHIPFTQHFTYYIIARNEVNLWKSRSFSMKYQIHELILMDDGAPKSVSQSLTFLPNSQLTLWYQLCQHLIVPLLQTFRPGPFSEILARADGAYLIKRKIGRAGACDGRGYIFILYGPLSTHLLWLL